MRSHQLIVGFVVLLVAGAALAAAAGETAPDFTATDTRGRPVKLSDFRGRYVVLEWTNPECPFVQRQYNGKYMQEQQKHWNERGVVWLTVNSTNKSSREFKTPAQMDQWMQSKSAGQEAIVIDADSATGRLYGAKTTPHMFVINPEGRIIYAGAIDDRPSTRVEDAPKINYVRAALSQAMAGDRVATANTTPYGCSVKY